MKRMKIEILISLLFIVVGLAAVTTNLIINGSTSIASNQDDFLVYFSDVKVDGTQDLSLVKNEKLLVFYKEFSAVGDKVTIDYDVTNASKNYDATISISCTESNDYLNVTNNFDQKSNLLARSTRTGTLTVELIKAVSQETSYEVKCTITGTAVERESQSNNNVSSPLVRTFNIGDELFIGSERFNIISTTSDTVTLLAKYNLGTNYKQNTIENGVTFSNSYGWSYTPGPKEIDIQNYDGNAKTYVNEYVSYLKSYTGESNLTGTLITLTELKALGCLVTDDYSNDNFVFCIDSEHKEWIINGQLWWTRSADPTYAMYYIWAMHDDGSMNSYGYNNNNLFGIRPVITMSKSYFQNDMISFTLDGKTYSVPNGSTWKDFLDSDQNDTEANYVDGEDYIYAPGEEHGKALLYNPQNLDITNMHDSCNAFDAGYTTEMFITDVIIKNGIYNLGAVICLGGWG